MKTVLLAGGFGTRISEESMMKPKPMIDIADKPVLWHIMKYYTQFGHDEFIICAGYKAYFIKEYFYHYYMHNSDLVVDMKSNNIEFRDSKAESWKISIVDTGLNTMTGGRIKRIKEYVGNETFFMTYGDGVGDVDLEALLKFHKESGKIATMTAVQPSGRFGALNIDGDSLVKSFKEKPKGDGAWVNGGFFVLEPEIFDYIDGDATTFEKEPLERLAAENQLAAFKHNGFWQPMDTLRDKIMLTEMIESKKAPWIIWGNK
ncbi:MAG: glucose-1-phosphate cytidylyltransferase [Spirochaetales bacterium]|nr:glucose-1-phosphate cytidylyltransferase [Spirochaetales bacterium]